MSVTRRCLKCMHGVCYRVRRRVSRQRNLTVTFRICATAALASLVRIPCKRTRSCAAICLCSMPRFLFPRSCRCDGLPSAETNLRATSVAFILLPKSRASQTIVGLKLSMRRLLTKVVHNRLRLCSVSGVSSYDLVPRYRSLAQV